MATATEIKAFIQRLGALAVAESNRRIAGGKGFVLPSVCIAQSAIETGWGTSGLMVRANAFFGIKAGGSWTGAVYRADTWEVANGESYNTTANFRAYSSVADSVTDYYNLIGDNSRYSNALSFGTDKSAWKTPKACITAIWSGGYATDTLYVEKIMNTINTRNLTTFDNLVTGKGSLPLPETESLNYNIPLTDFVQGELKIIDSARAIENDKTILTAIATDWNKAITIPAIPELTLTISGIPSAFEIYVVRLKEDSASIDSPIKNGDSFKVTAGEKIGFYMAYNPRANISPSAFPIYTLNLTSSVFYSDGAESYSSAIAYFVKL